MTSPTTFGALVSWAQARLELAANAIQAAGGERPQVHRWWQEGMPLPSAYLWHEAGAAVEVTDSCTVREDLVLVLCFASRPTQSQGADMYATELVVDAVIPVIDSACLSLARKPGVRKRPVRRPTRQVFDRWAGEGTERPLVVEVPVVIPWARHVTPEEAP